MLTPPRSDLPAIGDEIAIVHQSGQWYGGPDTVIAVDPSPPRPTAPRVTTRRWEFRCKLYDDENRNGPDWMGEVLHVFDATYQLRWNLVKDLSEPERKPIEAHYARVAKCTHIYGKTDQP